MGYNLAFAGFFVPPPDELDAVLEREDINRYVARLERGDLTNQPPEPYPWVPDPPTEVGDWDMETISVQWAALWSGYALPAASAPPPSPSPCSTEPTVRLVARQPSASAASASFTRRSPVTAPDPYTYRAANAIPNSEPDLTTMTVEQIAQARGITKRHAYSVMRRAQEEKMGAVVVPSNQRELILSILHRSGDYIRNTDQLSEAVRETGSKLPPHDVTKVLWSLQKSQYVRFRERASGMLYAIKLTPEGKKVAKAIAKPVVVNPEPDEAPPAAFVDQAIADADLDEVEQEQGAYTAKPSVVTNVGPDQQDEAHDLALEHVLKVAEGARKLQEEINAMGAGPGPGESGPGSDEDWGPTVPQGTPEPVVPWFKGNMGGWPSMRDVRDRHNKAVKIRTALALLEEVGEDDAVITLLDKVTFTPLEEEVVQLLRFLKEIE